MIEYIKKAVAKTNELNLILHLKAVSKICGLLMKQILKDDYPEKQKYIEIIQKIGLLHDIGKIISYIQEYLTNNKIKKDFKLHDEIGWAFLSNVLNENNYNSLILNSIYWHHGKNLIKDKNNSYSIINSLSNEDILLLEFFYNYLTKENIKFVEKEKPESIPEYFDNANNINFKYILFRSILISADRIVSGLDNNNDVEKILNDDKFCSDLINFNKISYNNIKKPTNYDNRFEIQNKISNICLKNKTTIIKANAGFGKTLMGILWTLRSNKKLIWICPRNYVTKNVYNSILNELKELKINNINVELYLTGKRIKTNNSNTEDFNSDIIVTNIDNFLNPLCSNSIAKRLYFINYCDVIFDEFHEFINDDAMFAGFIEIMKLRHRLTNSKTLLLSATPTIINNLWEDNSSNKTEILPSNNKHYINNENLKYEINYISEDNFNKINIPNDSCIITNTIRKAQILKKQKNIPILVHSNFKEEDKEKIFEKILSLYSKENKNSCNRESVVSGPIIKSSIDISFLNLYSFLTDIESITQEVGRCNRFGNYVNSKIILIDFNDNKELKKIEYTYDLELFNKFKILLKEYCSKNKFITIKEIYNIYNQFNIDNANEIKKFVKNKYDKSLENLSCIYLYKKIKKLSDEYNNNDILTDNNKIVLFDRTTIRNSKKQFYCLYEIYNTNEYICKVEILKYDISKQLEENKYNSINNIPKIIKKLNKQGIYKYSKKFEKSSIQLNELFKLSNNPETPYIALNKKYLNDFGLVNNDDIDYLI